MIGDFQWKLVRTWGVGWHLGPIEEGIVPKRELIGTRVMRLVALDGAIVQWTFGLLQLVAEASA